MVRNALAWDFIFSCMNASTHLTCFFRNLFIICVCTTKYSPRSSQLAFRISGLATYTNFYSRENAMMGKRMKENKIKYKSLFRQRGNENVRWNPFSDHGFENVILRWIR